MAPLLSAPLIVMVSMIHTPPCPTVRSASCVPALHSADNSGTGDGSAMLCDNSHMSRRQYSARDKTFGIVGACMNRGSSVATCLAAVSLAGCIVIGDSSVPIGTVAAAAPRPSAERTLVIVLPGFGSDAADL